VLKIGLTNQVYHPLETPLLKAWSWMKNQENATMIISRRNSLLSAACRRLEYTSRRRRNLEIYPSSM
jgi:hypothetical protein